MTELNTADPDIERLYTSREGLTIMLHNGETIDLPLDLLTEACTAIMQQWRVDWAKQDDTKRSTT